VEANAPRGAYRTVAITAQDIFAADLNFLFGMGRCPGKCAVVSTYRFGFYCATPERRMVRFAKLIVHEAGHTFGLLHCRQRLCIMKFAEGYETLDGTKLAMCARCERSLCAVTALDADERRKNLEEVLKEGGTAHEALLASDFVVKGSGRPEQQITIQMPGLSGIQMKLLRLFG